MRMIRQFNRDFVRVPLVLACLATASALAESPTISHGTARFEPTAGEAALPERFRLAAHEFDFVLTPRPKVSDRLTIADVTFPSPVTTDFVENNTVHCEYYRPNKSGKVPGVVVLHILGGDFPLARTFANAIAQRGCAAIFMKMPFYGPRRPPNSAKRMMSREPSETVDGMTQAVLDIRQTTAWLAARDEIDADQLGIFGISLGGITGSLAIANEPRLKNGCFLLAGGDMVKIVLESKELEKERKSWLDAGLQPEGFVELMRAIDPVTYAARARDRRILMINASHDEVIPKSCTESLWREFGQPEIVWYDGGHYSVVRHLLHAMKRTQDFFATSP